MIHTLFAVTLLVGGTMTGVEMAIGWLVHPALYRLTPRTHAATAIEIARVQGKVMPFWYAATAGLTALAAAWVFTADPVARWLAAGSAALWIGSIIYTLLGPVRINNEVVTWDAENPPADWLDKRRAWDFLHAIRVVVLLAAFGLLVNATIAASAATSLK